MSFDQHLSEVCQLEAKCETLEIENGRLRQRMAKLTEAVERTLDTGDIELLYGLVE